MTVCSLAVLKALLAHFEKVTKSAKGSLPKCIPTPTEALRSAIRCGKVATLDTLIGIWKEFDDIIYDGQEEVGAVLHYAARYGSVDSMKWLWAQPNIATDVNKVVGCYGTPLQAAIVGNIDVDVKVTCLLTWGADVSRKGGLTGTALNAATAQLKIRVAKAILERLNKGNVNIIAGQWGSPIEAVLSANEPNLSEGDVETWDMMDLLISKGVSAASQGGFWHTALHAAANAHALCTVKYLLKQKHVSKDERDLMGRLPLHLAAMRGHWEMVQELSSGNSTFLSEDHQGRNVLHMAAGLGRLSIVDKLLENVQIAYELINSTDNDGWTPLHWACHSASKEIVELLLRRGASKTARTINKSWLPFHVAVYHGQDFSDDLKVNAVPHNPDEAPPMLIYCSCCLCMIFGTLYKCMAKHVYCGDFNLCFKCYRHASTIHFRDHRFSSVE
ncbi:hypothetical protein JMJ35_010177 [Cladonia borealis]|uniref:Ankyrin n=1 Tax=Cladonia borealis TaxID=184061 RepID=A0AA39QSL3_9LECA|nr:hypothetical protein JMJ35_010177 [Cladonia borealis]